MSGTLNRRKLLKTGALLAGGISLIPGLSFLDKATAGPVATPLSFETMETDASAILSAPPDIKARLSANENPFGPSPKAKKAIQDAIDGSFRYPFMHFSDLTAKIAAFEGIDKEQVMLASGSSPLLKAAGMYYSKDGGNIVVGDPSYDDLIRTAVSFKEQIKKVPLTSDYKLDLDAMEKAVDADTKLVYICNPNNPTATVVDTAKLKSFCERVSKKTMLFIDEAYIDYLEDPQSVTMIDAVKKGQNIIVARTFSKLYGFAGLRVGYIIGQPDTLKTLGMYTEGAFSISAPSLQAAIASYQDQEFLQGAKVKTLASRQFLYDTLKKEGYEYIPSSANFVMFPIKMDGQKFNQEMMKRGVSLRFWKFNNKDWCRVSIGTMDEMTAFAAAFKEIS